MIKEKSLSGKAGLVPPAFNAETYLVAFALKPSKAVGSVAFSRDGLWIAISIVNGYLTNAAVKLWSTAPTP